MDNDLHGIRKRTPLERVYEAVFGPDGNPEEGLVYLFHSLEKEVRPIVRFFNSAKWPPSLPASSRHSSAGSSALDA